MIALAFYLAGMAILIYLAFWVIAIGIAIVVRILVLPFELLTWLWECGEKVAKWGSTRVLKGPR